MDDTWHSVRRPRIWWKMHPQAGRYIYATRVRVRKAVLLAFDAACFDGPERSVNGLGDFAAVDQCYGRFVAFLAVTQSQHPRQAALQPGAKNSGYRQVFVRDTCLGASGCTPRRRAFRCNLVMAHPPPRSEQVRRWQERQERRIGGTSGDAFHTSGGHRRSRFSGDYKS